MLRTNYYLVMINFMITLTMIITLMSTVSCWDLKPSAEKYWTLRKLGLKPGHEIPYTENVSSIKKTDRSGHYPTSTHHRTHHNHHSPSSFSSSTYSSYHTNRHHPSRMAPGNGNSNNINSNNNLNKVQGSGCNYKGKRYHDSEEVITSQPCLNCTCQRGFVSCFLKVCPVLNPPEDDSCYFLKDPATCCATLKCPPNSLDPLSLAPSDYHHSHQHHNHMNQSSPGHNSKFPSFHSNTRHSGHGYGYDSSVLGHFSGGNGIERKAESGIGGSNSRWPTSRPPYKDFWPSPSSSTSNHSPASTTSKRPSTLHPSLSSSSSFSSTSPFTPPTRSSSVSPTRQSSSSTIRSSTHRPTISAPRSTVKPTVAMRQYPPSPTFSQRRPSYPFSPGPKNPTSTSTTTTSRKPSSSFTSSSSSSWPTTSFSSASRTTNKPSYNTFKTPGPLASSSAMLASGQKHHSHSSINHKEQPLRSPSSASNNMIKDDENDKSDFFRISSLLI